MRIYSLNDGASFTIPFPPGEGNPSTGFVLDSRLHAAGRINTVMCSAPQPSWGRRTKPVEQQAGRRATQDCLPQHFLSNWQE